MSLSGGVAWYRHSGSNVAMSSFSLFAVKTPGLERHRLKIHPGLCTLENSPSDRAIFNLVVVFTTFQMHKCRSKSVKITLTYDYLL